MPKPDEIQDLLLQRLQDAVMLSLGIAPVVVVPCPDLQALPEGKVFQKGLQVQLLASSRFCTSSCKLYDRGKLDVSQAKTGVPTSPSSSCSGACDWSAVFALVLGVGDADVNSFR